MEVKEKMGLGFGIYEVEDKEDGVWGFRFQGFEHNPRNFLVNLRGITKACVLFLVKPTLN